MYGIARSIGIYVPDDARRYAAVGVLYKKGERACTRCELLVTALWILSQFRPNLEPLP